MYDKVVDDSGILIVWWEAAVSETKDALELEHRTCTRL
jgi:hypothetical protein